MGRAKKDALRVPSVEALKSTPFYFGAKEVYFLPKQWECVFANEPELAYVGGYGCFSRSLKINGIDAPDITESSVVPTLFGRAVASRVYLKGRADLYRVLAKSGREVEVTLDHRFLSPVGWRRLRDLGVGSLIAVDEILDDLSWTERQSDCQDNYSLDSRRRDVLPPPASVAYLDIGMPRHTPDYAPSPFASACRPSTDSSCRRVDRGFSSSLHGVLACGESPRRRLHIDQQAQRSYCRLGIAPQSLPSEGRFSSFRAFCEFHALSEYGSPSSDPCQVHWQRHAECQAYETNQVFDRDCTSHDTYTPILAKWEEIVDIQFAYHGDFYDLSVPGPEHYLAGGIYHHNSGKTQTGIQRATRLSTWFPGNRGIIGRYAATDLAATTQRDAIEFWTEANLLDDFKERGKYKVPTAILRCVDPYSQEILPGKYSEVQFLHLDDPTHIHGHRIGWAWADEASEITEEAYNKLMSRIRLKGYEQTFSLWVTGNPEGHNWIYKHFYDPEELSKLSDDARVERRSIHATTYENWFLPEEYVRNMHNSYSETMRKKYLEGSFDVFDGQIYDEFSTSVHVLSRDVFSGGVPHHWNRLLAVDVGGTDPWAWLWVAVDENGYCVVYHEIYRPGTRVYPFAVEARPKIDPYRFQAKVIDYENKVAAGELAEHGINFTNAKKTNKNESIFRLSGYIHPNEELPFPRWHPNVGQKGSPRLFITPNCKSLIAELPQQRWRKVRGQDGLQNEPDPNVPDHAVDALRYIMRELPHATQLHAGIIADLPTEISKMGKILNFERRQASERKRSEKWDAIMGAGRMRGRKERNIGWPT